jgi:hypothetical protein
VLNVLAAYGRIQPWPREGRQRRMPTEEVVDAAPDSVAWAPRGMPHPWGTSA